MPPAVVYSLSILSAVFICFLPNAWLMTLLSVSHDTANGIADLTIQLIAVGFLVAGIRNSQSKSESVFWKFILLSIVSVAGLAQLPNFVQTPMSAQLYQDVSFLLGFFFVILSLETNPHLSSVPHPANTTGVVPAILFTVICFGYFVLLPASIDKSYYVNHQTSRYFYLLVDTIICVRVIASIVTSPSTYWRFIYSILFFSGFFLLVEVAGPLLTKDINNLPIHTAIPRWVFLPVLIAMVVAKYIPKPRYPDVTPLRDSTPYTLALTGLLVSVHLYSITTPMPFLLHVGIQSALTGIWLATAFILILFNHHKRNRQFHSLQSAIIDKDRNITQGQKHVEALQNALRFSEDTAIVTVSSNAILTCSMEGKILSANPAAVQMFQYLEETLKQRNISTLFAHDDELRHFFSFQSNVFALQRKESGISTEANALRSDQQEFPVQVSLQWAERHENPLIVITFINLTARKLAEKQTLEMKDRFIANISHEFRTPLSIINGILDRFLPQLTNAKDKDDIHTAKRNGLRLVRMVEQLLELSRLANNPKLNLATYQVHHLLEMPVASFSHLAEQSGLSFDADLPAGIWIECDAQGVEKILFNLLANAIKYTPKGGSVRLVVGQREHEVTIDVIDSGIGIHSKFQDKIFDRFQRAENSEHQGIFGVGIGLSLVNELVKAHGWRISVVSEQDQGSKFTLTIPLAEAKKEAELKPTSITPVEVNAMLNEEASSSTQTSERSQHVVLVIEDNPDMQSHLKQIIEREHHCLLAGSGEQGVALAEQFVPDLIVSDLMLPAMDGFEVLKQVKQSEITSHVPVILLTARADLDTRLEGLQLQADDYLSKPFNHHELCIRINNLINSRKQLHDMYQEKLDTEQKALRREGIENAHHQDTDEHKVLTTLDDKFIQKLEQQISQLYQNAELDIASIAANLAMSERQLQRKVKVLLDTSPALLLRQFRLNKAQELLREGHQVGRIAMDVGFSSQTYFGRCFKEAFGCTPKQYQKSATQKPT